MSKLEDKSALKYLIHEEIYWIEEELPVANKAVVTTEAPVAAVETSVAPETKSEPTPEPATSPEVSSKPEVASEPEVAYVNRVNKVLLVFNNPDADALPDAQKAYLEKILGAVKLKFGSVDMINCALDTVNVNGYKKVISFTDQYTPPVSAKYKVEAKGECEMLLADDLSAISISTVLRKQLWEALQQMFL